jgi:hypothetical protein
LFARSLVRALGETVDRPRRLALLLSTCWDAVVRGFVGEVSGVGCFIHDHRLTDGVRRQLARRVARLGCIQE